MESQPALVPPPRDLCPEPGASSTTLPLHQEEMWSQQRVGMPQLSQSLL